MEQQKTERLTLRETPELVKCIDEVAKLHGLKRAATVGMLIRKGLRAVNEDGPMESHGAQFTT
ncbi:MAG: hypothetical protein OEY28_11915 [Nitrospira sp.]|nr:hypothetical protein [Nitrospira sp.]